MTQRAVRPQQAGVLRGRHAERDLQRRGVHQFGQLFVGRHQRALDRRHAGQRPAERRPQRRVVQISLRLVPGQPGPCQSRVGLVRPRLGLRLRGPRGQHRLPGRGGGQFRRLDQRLGPHAPVAQVRLTGERPLPQVGLLLRGGQSVRRDVAGAQGIAPLGLGIGQVGFGPRQRRVRVHRVDPGQHVALGHHAAILEPLGQFDDPAWRGGADLKRPAALHLAIDAEDRHDPRRVGGDDVDREHPFARGRHAGLPRHPLLHRAHDHGAGKDQQTEGQRCQEQPGQAVAQKSHRDRSLRRNGPRRRRLRQADPSRQACAAVMCGIRVSPSCG